MPKFSLISISLVSLTLTVLLLYYWASSGNQQQQITRLKSHVTKLQTELDMRGESRVEIETRLKSMERQLNASNNRVVSLEAQLNAARDMINSDLNAEDVDVVRLEQQIRQRVLAETRQESPPLMYRTRLLQQLNTLDPQELAEIMSIQGTYGGFLQQLDVDGERLEVIIDGLGNIVEERNQQLMDLVSELQDNPDGVEQIQQRIIDNNTPEALRNTLSFLLTEEELAVYDATREQQQTQDGFIQTQAFTLQTPALNSSLIRNGNQTSNSQTDQGQTARIRIISTVENELHPQP